MEYIIMRPFTKAITLGILADFYEHKFPKSDREKLMLLLWVIHLLRRVPGGQPVLTIDEQVRALVLESKKLKTLRDE